MKVGLYGGTFDPIHFGHLLLAEWTVEHLSLDKIFFIPAFIPPHKRHALITPADFRLRMIELAVQGNPKFEISSVEIDRGDVSYSIDTILYFRKKLTLTPAQLFFLIGADSLIDFPKWHRPQEILDNCQVVVYQRPEFNLSAAREKIRQKVIIFDNPRIEISSSDIRQRLYENRTVKYMLPANVEEFIARKALYKKKS